MASCCPDSRKSAVAADQAPALKASGALEEVVWIPGGASFLGTANPLIPEDGEGPERPVKLEAYGLEALAATNARFAEFVAATGYVTEAEKFGWSAVFTPPPAPGEAGWRGWWRRVEGADWRRPEGPGSSIAEIPDHPVVQVSWRDASAFAAWVGGRLPGEAEWEHAARGGAIRRRYPWGDEEPDDEAALFCNIWQGRFPDLDTARDGYSRTAPARSFAPNPLGLYNMAGNVWEWTREPFRIRSLSLKAKARDSQAAAQGEKLLKGGSFLCHASYCHRYRIAARMGLTPDSAANNVGFRVACDPPR